MRACGWLYEYEACFSDCFSVAPLLLFLFFVISSRPLFSLSPAHSSLCGLGFLPSRPPQVSFLRPLAKGIGEGDTWV